jgi:hypothetical protein
MSRKGQRWVKRSGEELQIARLNRHASPGGVCRMPLVAARLESCRATLGYPDGGVRTKCRQRLFVA